MKAIVDPDTCTGCTLCTDICPEVFRMEGDVAVAYTDPVPADKEDDAQDAADQCPVEAIEIK
ncbi:MAG: ferredoxin [Spirochaetia bacterium]